MQNTQSWVPNYSQVQYCLLLVPCNMIIEYIISILYPMDPSDFQMHLAFSKKKEQFIGSEMASPLHYVKWPHYLIGFSLKMGFVKYWSSLDIGFCLPECRRTHLWFIKGTSASTPSIIDTFICFLSEQVNWTLLYNFLLQGALTILSRFAAQLAIAFYRSSNITHAEAFIFAGTGYLFFPFFWKFIRLLKFWLTVLFA